MASLLGLLTLFDSNFPTGSFARSNGYESARQFGLITDRQSLLEFCLDGLENMSAQHLPIISSVYHSINQSNLTAANRSERQIALIFDHILDINECLDVTLICNHIEYNASQSQGKSLLRTLGHMDDWTSGGDDENYSICNIAREVLHEWREQLDLLDEESDFKEGVQNVTENKKYLKVRLSSDTPPHFTVVTALACLSLNMGHRECCLAFLFGYVRSTISAAVRDGLIGPNDAQRLISEILGLWKSPNDRSNNRSNDRSNDRSIVEDLIQMYGHHRQDLRLTCPMIDLLQSAHSLLFSKLFLS